VIYRTIGDKARIEVEVSVTCSWVSLVAVSDGLSGMLDDQTILKTF
jgi:hypothetical protein